MKKLLALFVVTGLVATLTGCPGVTTAPITVSTVTTVKPAEEKTVEGKVVSFDKDKGEVVVKVGDKETTYKDLKDNKEVKWDDVKKDADVKVTTKGDKVTKIEKK